MKKYLLLLLLAASTTVAFAGNLAANDSIKVLSHPPITNSAPDASDAPQTIDKSAPPRSPFSSFEFLLSLCVLVFGLFVICLEVWLAKQGIIHSEHIFKCIIITLIITGSILLITAGYSNNQITGITGILGSISGYLLAKVTPADRKGSV